MSFALVQRRLVNRQKEESPEDQGDRNLRELSQRKNQLGIERSNYFFLFAYTRQNVNLS